jgi:hypothetical protein
MRRIAFTITGFWVAIAMATSSSTAMNAEMAQDRADADPLPVTAAPAANPQYVPSYEPSSQLRARQDALTDQFGDITPPNTANAPAKAVSAQAIRSAAPSTMASRRAAYVTHDFVTRPAIYFRGLSGIW